MRDEKTSGEEDVLVKKYLADFEINCHVSLNCFRATNKQTESTTNTLNYLKVFNYTSKKVNYKSKNSDSLNT